MIECPKDLLQASHSSCKSGYKQKNGRIKRNGSKMGMIKREHPQVKKLPTMAIKMIHRMEKEKIKHPPLFRY